ncbi:putative RNA-binding protein [Trypanosoma vivax]|nr:putative RNA-binding protein [Trypanosoma vivax]
MSDRGVTRRRRSSSPDNRHHYHGRYHYQRNSTHDGYHGSESQRHRRELTPPRRSQYNSRGRDDATYSIPSAAPRLYVPHNLPIDVMAFIDLVAFYVMHGGPTAEEEIMKRERNNPHFAFLYARWNDPMQLYYRWRLYSLLQGDTLLKWRTEPYQIERGSASYVWVPPPPIASGPECLLAAFTSGPSHDEGVTDNAKPAAPAVRDESAVAPLAVHTRRAAPSASWLSRMCVSEGAFFVTLDQTAMQEWRSLLSAGHLLEELLCPKANVPSSNTALSADEKSLEERVNVLAAALLDNERMGRRMVFAVEHQKAALHVVSIVLDEVVHLAYESVESVREPHKGAEGSGSGPSTETALLSAFRCCLCLSYLFTLNDIGRNSSAIPLSDEEVAQIASTTHEGVGGSSAVVSGGGGTVNNIDAGGCTTTLGYTDIPHTAPSVLLPPSHSSLSQNAPTASRLINRALEKIMPTLIEATLVVALCTVHQYGSLQVDSARDTGNDEAKPPEAEETEGILPLGLDHTDYLHLQARLSSVPVIVPSALQKEDRDSVCMIALLLMSWLKQLCTAWYEGEVIGSRCWSTLVTRYAFLLSHSIEVA